jgi:hypothetical protein
MLLFFLNKSETSEPAPLHRPNPFISFLSHFGYSEEEKPNISMALDLKIYGTSYKRHG